jgi:hypothetical protein
MEQRPRGASVQGSGVGPVFFRHSFRVPAAADDPDVGPGGACMVGQGHERGVRAEVPAPDLTQERDGGSHESLACVGRPGRSPFKR